MGESLLRYGDHRGREVHPDEVFLEEIGRDKTWEHDSEKGAEQSMFESEETSRWA